MASFFIVVVFLPHNYSTVASSEAPADYQPAPGRTDGVPERHQRQWIINPSLQICAWNRSWIKGLGKNPQKSELIHWRQCLLSGGTEACSLGLRETPACIHVIQRLSQPRVACWHGFRQNSQKTECVFTHCPTGGRKTNCVFKRPPKWRG